MIFAAAALAGVLHLMPCTRGRAKVPARCGTYTVYENRATRKGRVLALNVVVVPAAGRSRGVIAEISGGPGEASTDLANPVVDGSFQVPFHKNFDLLMVDARGMGRSNPFGCNLFPPDRPAAYLSQDWPLALVRQCRSAAAPAHDFAWYNTNAAVDDLDDVRAALHIPKVVLVGGSYGTFFSLVYIRRHGDHVAAAVLDGVDPPGFQGMPGAPIGAQTALDDLFAKCRADASCNGHFPLFKAHFYAVLDRFDRGPVMVPAENLKTKKFQTVALTKEVLVDQIRHLLYDPFGGSYLPYAIERAYANDYTPLARMVQTAILGLSAAQDYGANLSYTCADWMPFVTPSQMSEARAHSFAGDLRARSQQRACAIWNVPPMPASFNEPVRSGVPILMITGSDDPATPPGQARAALAYLPDARNVLVRGGGHGADTPCTNALVARFVEQRGAVGLNTGGCTATFKLPPFATSMKGWPTLEEVLAS